MILCMSALHRRCQGEAIYFRAHRWGAGSSVFTLGTGQTVEELDLKHEQWNPMEEYGFSINMLNSLGSVRKVYIPSKQPSFVKGESTRCHSRYICLALSVADRFWSCQLRVNPKILGSSVKQSRVVQTCCILLLLMLNLPGSWTVWNPLLGNPESASHSLSHS